MTYVDTSVLIPLCVFEPKSASVAAWCEAYDGQLVSVF
jgi:predicted nucleic acid-binding protein